MIRSKIVSLVLCLCFFSASVFAALLEHTVLKGETLTSISHDFSVSIDEICKENGIPKDTMLKAGQKLKIPVSISLMQKTESYTVEQGDTLSGIAQKFEMSVSEIKRLNDLSTDTIKTGQTLKVYEKTVSPELGASTTETYKVAQGDTLFSIARKFSMSVPYLKELNTLSSDTIKVGQSLKVIVNSTLPEMPEMIDRSSGKQGDASLVWPVKPTSVTYVKGKISGVQLETAKDEDTVSISSGEVTFSGPYRGYGQVVFVQNSPYVYGYTGLANVSVQRGDKVSQGRLLGKAGVDALSGKNQILFMVYKNGKPMDPASAPRD